MANRAEFKDNENLFDLPAPKISFPEEEEKILRYWDEIDAFQNTLKQSAGKPLYSFYDGPPFATGLPHYGHILAGTIKDIVTRYAHQTHHHVIRRFGWDCHGLPIEYEIDKELKFNAREDVLKYGIDNYNEKCRAIVMRYAKDWEQIVKRMGRWIDFSNDYKTLNPSFMESVWWVFKRLFEQGLVYEGFKVMPFSYGCHTALSNFEAGQNYKNVKDPAIVVNFPLVNDNNVQLLAWTTTPWTLPSNLALCVHPELTYVKVRNLEANANKGKIWILAESRLVQMFKNAKTGELDSTLYEVIEKMPGKKLEGLEYVPLFEYFIDEKKKNGAFRVLTDSYVTEDSGTGVVHQAPGFGEDDYRVCMKHGVIKSGQGVVCPVDSNGCFTESVPDYKGRNVKAADRAIIERLKQAKRLEQDAEIEHPYPHCWRSDTPLLYKAVPSWFVKVTSFKDRLVNNNQKTYWVPDHVKDGRFHNWLLDARDWSISRDRFWGTPIPVWQSEDKTEIEVIGSIEELKEKSGVKREINDLHCHKIDDITIMKNGKVLRRVTPVFDCWFESGSMPYAQVHYPFENKEIFEKSFPADFIAEGVDQTRGWFYTLMVISTALFDQPAFKNLIVNGIVLAADGNKMSKRLKNYDDPVEVVKKYSADALRLYLITSPVVRADDLKFQTKGVEDMVKEFILFWFNTYKLFVEQARARYKQDGVLFQASTSINMYECTSNPMDKWILTCLQALVKAVRDEMAAYRLYTIMPQVKKFIVQLSNWYVNLNKNRLQGDSDAEEWNTSLQVLFEVLYKLCLLMAPLTPFLADYMYLNLRKAFPPEERKDSVHYLFIPEYNAKMRDEHIEATVSRLQSVIELGRKARSECGLTFRTPLPELIVVHRDESYLRSVEELASYVKKDINIRNLRFSSNVDEFGHYTGEPNHKSLGRFGNKKASYDEAIKALSHNQLLQLSQKGSLKLADLPEPITAEDVLMSWLFMGDQAKYQVASSIESGFMVLLDKQGDQSCVEEGMAREVMSRVQQLRKVGKFTTEDEVEVFFDFDGPAPKLQNVIKKWKAYITNGIRVTLLPLSLKPEGVEIVVDDKLDAEIQEKAIKEKMEREEKERAHREEMEAKAKADEEKRKIDKLLKKGSQKHKGGGNLDTEELKEKARQAQQAQEVDERKLRKDQRRQEAEKKKQPKPTKPRVIGKEIDNEVLRVYIAWRVLVFAPDAVLIKANGASKASAEGIKNAALALEREIGRNKLRQKIKLAGNKLELQVAGKKVELELNKHFFFSLIESPAFASKLASVEDQLQDISASASASAISKGDSKFVVLDPTKLKNKKGPSLSGTLPKEDVDMLLADEDDEKSKELAKKVAAIAHERDQELFGGLPNAESMAQLNQHLASRSYISGYSFSYDDVSVFRRVVLPFDIKKYPHVHRWFIHIESFSDFIFSKVASRLPKPLR